MLMQSIFFAVSTKSIQPQKQHAPRLAVEPQALFKRGKQQDQPQRKKQKHTRKQQQQQDVAYGRHRYPATREAAQPKRSVRQELAAEYRRQANLEANNGRERKDLYTDNWDGAEYKGSPWNILNVLLAVSILAPVAGLIFAFQTYGILWG